MLLPYLNTKIRLKRPVINSQLSKSTAAIRYSAVTLLSLTAIAGCGHRDAASTRQVVARVNGQEITIHQLKNEAAGFSANSAIPNATPTRETLDTLINEQLLMEQGKERKIDRDPQVIQAEEKAHRQIRLQVLQNQLVASLPQPTQSEIRSFYDANEGLFANRKIYTFRQFTVDGNALNDNLKSKLERSKTEQAIVAALKSDNLNYHEIITVRTAEQLPMQALPSITNMNRGDVAVFKSGDRTDVLQIVDFIAQPATLEQATPVIREYLLSSKKKTKVDDLLKTLRATAKIEYFGPFGKDATATAQANPHTQPSSPTSAATSNITPAENKEQPPSKPNGDVSVVSADNKSPPAQSVMPAGKI